jgi:hypothetical protein
VQRAVYLVVVFKLLRRMSRMRVFASPLTRADDRADVIPQVFRRDVNPSLFLIAEHAPAGVNLFPLV